MRIADVVESLAAPVVAGHGCELWDVEYIKESGQWFLRVYIDKEGGVNITDCEAISQALDPILDEKDPIPGSYTFEVSSAGAERRLKKDRDFERCIGRDVLVRLFAPRDGKKEFAGKLLSYDDGAVEIECDNNTVRFEKSEYSLVRLRIDF